MGVAQQSAEMTEAQKVWAWRWHVCRHDLKLTEDEADYIATSEIDLHAFARLLNKGCSKVLAFKILA